MFDKLLKSVKPSKSHNNLDDLSNSQLNLTNNQKNKKPKSILTQSQSPTKNKKSKTLRRIRDMYFDLPSHFKDRIKDIDSLLSNIVVRIHSTLCLTLSNIHKKDKNALDCIKESMEWDQWYSKMRSSIIKQKKSLENNLNDLQNFFTKVLDREDQKDIIEDCKILISGKTAEKISILGIEELSSPESILCDVSGLLGDDINDKLPPSKEKIHFKVNNRFLS